jgi:hypothetical protein
MKNSLFVVCLFGLFAFSINASSYPTTGGVVIDIVDNDGKAFPVYEISKKKESRIYRAYLEAVYGENYKIRVRNQTNQRVGLVIAVDGRNIISGNQSNLGSTERMYVLGPYEQARYDGWRTSQSQVHRFFFTDSENSYADAWGDHSAMGVIAVAVYREQISTDPYRKQESKSRRESGKPKHPSSISEMESAGDAAAQPGTGFGSEYYSPVRIVRFDPLPQPTEKFFYKYEWRETLCVKGILNCRQPKNRFWPDDPERYGFVPYPPEY